MDKSLAEQLIRSYVDGWKEYDTAKIGSTLHPTCVLIESDGETFHGAEKIISEVEKRIAGEYGSWSIKQWDITFVTVADESSFVEWTFEGRHAFEGASLVRYTDDKISYVREYCTLNPLWESGSSETEA